MGHRLACGQQAQNAFGYWLPVALRLRNDKGRHLLAPPFREELSENYPLHLCRQTVGRPACYAVSQRQCFEEQHRTRLVVEEPALYR